MNTPHDGSSEDGEEHGEPKSNHLIGESIIGASYLARGFTNFRQWSRKMLSDCGERIRPFLPNLFDNSKRMRGRLKVIYASSEKAANIAEVLAEAKAGEPLDPKMVYDLARAHINAGVEGVDAVMKAVHADLETQIEGLTERDVRDAFREYGKLVHGEVSYPNREQDVADLRDAQVQLLSAREKWNEMLRHAPSKTPPSDERNA
jgi:hypothetical protein